ncbi:MAG: GGDEF domain-containing protein [Defluviitaleaceae bacterium]|nr:GGDEF domain-containing protein [Defluviitaleaceae bacterium]
MKNPFEGRFALLSVAVLPFVLLIIIILVNNGSALPKVGVAGHDNVWDLRGVDMTRHNVRFEGDISYIPDALLCPVEFARREHEAVTGIVNRERAATSRLTILLPDDGWYTLSRPSLYFGARIYVNGELLLEIGSPHEDRAANIPDTGRIAFTARPIDGVIEIVQQSSNHVHRGTGEHYNWTVGRGTALLDENRVSDFQDTIMMGAFFALALALLPLAYFLKAHSRGIMYCMMFCLVCFFRIGVIGGSVFTVLMPWLDWHVKYKVEYITVPLAAVLAAAIVPTLFPNVLHKVFYRVFYALMGSLIAVYLFGGTLFISYVKLGSYLIYGAVILYILICFVVKVRKVNVSQAFFFAGVLVFMVSSVLDILYFTLPFFSVRFSGLGMFFFAICKVSAVFIATVNEFEATRERERIARKAATTDALTGVRNRRYFVDKAERELANCIRNGRDFSFIIADIDRFKSINDRFGHIVGDEVLKIFTSRVRHVLKQETVIARYGGEEFVIIMPGVGYENALKTAQRVSRVVSNSPFYINDMEIEVTASFGVASKTDDIKELAEIINSADKAMYRAKEAGRNRVMGFMEEG